MRFTRNQEGSDAFPMIIGGAIAVVAGLTPLLLPATEPHYQILVLLVACGLAFLVVVNRVGLARPLLLFALGGSMIFNPKKLFLGGNEILLSFGGMPAYFISLTDLCLLALICIPIPAPKQGWRHHASPAKGAMFTMLGLYMAFFMLSLYNATDASLVFTQFAFELKCMILFSVVAFFLDRGEKDEVIARTVMPMMYGLACGVILEAGIAVAEYLQAFPASLDVLGIKVGGAQESLGSLDVSRVGGTYRHPNYLAVPMAVLLAPLSMAALISRGFGRLLFFAATGGALTALVLTLSRGGWVAACLTIFILGLMIFISQGGRAWFSKHKAALLFLTVFVCVVLSAFSGTIYRKLFLSDPLNIQSREHLNQMALDMIADHPLLGVGLNNAVVSGSNYKYYDIYEEAFGLPPVVHNIYLLIASEIGVLGLLTFLGFLAMVICYSWRGIRAPGGGLGTVLLCGLSAGMWGYLAADMFGPSLRKVEIAYQLWWHIGMVVLLTTLQLDARGPTAGEKP